MKNKLIIIIGVLLASLLLSNYFMFKQMRQNKQDAVRWENNYTESKNNVSRVQLFYDEFKEEKTEEIDSLLKELSIKPKQVETIVTITNEYENTDTIYVPMEVTPKRDVFTFSKKIDCTMIEGFIATKDNIPKLNITFVSHVEEIDHVTYWSRRKYRILGIKTKLFGRKVGELKATTNCGKVSIKQIDIIKKK